jgi:hypothetical protein
MGAGPWNETGVCLVTTILSIPGSASSVSLQVITRVFSSMLA